MLTVKRIHIGKATIICSLIDLDIEYSFLDSIIIKLTKSLDAHNIDPEKIISIQFHTTNDKIEDIRYNVSYSNHSDCRDTLEGSIFEFNEI